MRERLTSDQWEEWAVNRYMERMKSTSPHLKYSKAHPWSEPLRPNHRQSQLRLLAVWIASNSTGGR